MRVLLLFLLLIGLTAGQPAEVVFRTHPPGAAIYRQIASNRDNVAYLGQAGQPILLPLDQIRSRNLQLVFRLEGYHDRRETVPKVLLQGGVYPPEGALELEPRSWWIPLAWFLSHRPGWAGVGLLAAAALLFGFFRRQAQIRRALERARSLESLRARAGDDPRAMIVLGGFRLLERLGAGGMATVYRAVPDLSLDESAAVAIKVLSQVHGADPDFRERFRREVQVCLRLSHPSVVRLYDYGEQPGLLFLVMELVKGKTLRETMREGLPFEQALQLLEQLMDGVDYAHRRGVVHRDLKPENVLLSEEGRLKIADFGLARAADSDRLTRAGALMGTPSYMAPEQVTPGETFLPASDQYSVGVIAYELLTGRKPFLESEAGKVLFLHLHQAPAPLRSLRPEIPEAVEKVVLRMLAKRPLERYRTVGDAARALREAAANAEDPPGFGTP